IRTRLYFSTIFSLLLLTVVGAMGYLALDRARATLHELFARQVHALTEMGELRTSLGHLRRAEKDIIINYNNPDEVDTLRGVWTRQLDGLRAGLAQVRTAQQGDGEFAKAIDQALAEVGSYADGIT